MHYTYLKVEYKTNKQKKIHKLILAKWRHMASYILSSIG